jgi:hypothetical protein
MGYLPFLGRVLTRYREAGLKAGFKNGVGRASSGRKNPPLLNKFPLAAGGEMIQVS